MAKLGDLNIGDTVKFGRFLGADIEWEIADKNHAGFPEGSVTLVSKYILALRAFDAAEPSNFYGDRQTWGNNDYAFSNIRQWANSQAGPGQWYVDQHRYDAPPIASNLMQKKYPYNDKSGFLADFTDEEIAAILPTDRTYGRYVHNQKTCTDKVWLPTISEYGSDAFTNDGSILSLFSDSDKRLKTPTTECLIDCDLSSIGIIQYWTATSYTNWDSVHYIRDPLNLTTNRNAYTPGVGFCPAVNLPSTTVVGSNGAVTFSQPPTTPTTITVPESPQVSVAFTVAWEASTDPDGDAVSYVLERRYDSGTWSVRYSGTVRSISETLETGHTTVQYRVKAVDSNGAESEYRESLVRTISNNRAPVINASTTSLGTFSDNPPSWTYSVTDPDGDAVTVTEYLDGAQTASKSVTLGANNTITIASDKWLTLSNGTHTFKVVAKDSKGASAEKSVTFIKSVLGIDFQISPPMTSTVMPTKATVAVLGSMPTGSVLKVEVTNNALDTSPKWEDCTAQSKNGEVYYFKNASKTAANWAVSYHVTLDRGTATGDVYITEVRGNWG